MQRPNLVLILADDLGFSDIGCFGSEIKTPHLDSLGHQGARLTELYNNARCCPSRASILTGVSAHRAGIGHMVDDWGVGAPYQGWLRTVTTTIAEALKDVGYRTLYSGKWHLNWSFEADPDQPPDTHHEKLGQPGYPQHLLQQDRWVKPPQPGYYITDAITDQAIRMIDQCADADAPFFLHLSHVAPHWPLQALPDDIARYRDTYVEGWDVIRQRRHARMQTLGIINSDWACSPRDEYAPAWDSLDADQQQWESQRMAVYAAMVDRMDQSIGRLLAHLRATQQADNTLVMFLSDNGGCAEFLREDGWCQWYGHPCWDGRAMRLGNDPKIQPGPDDTFMSYGLPWANASNTPFRLFKHFVHEGGIATPAVVAWPTVIPAGGMVHTPCHIEDIMPTFLQAEGVDIPNEVHGENLLPALATQRSHLH